jgi:hypothetical membrane protein
MSARVAACAALLLFVVALLAFGAMLDGYMQSVHPVSLLGAQGIPRAMWFNVCGFVGPGLLSAFVAWRLRESLPAGVAWPARIGARLVLLSALAFVAQGIWSLDPADLESNASRVHATLWTLWWVAFVPGAWLHAWGLRRRGGWRWLAGLAIGTLLLVAALFADGLLAPALAQRLAFALWFAWMILAAGTIDRRRMA